MNDGPRKKENKDDTGDEKGLEYDEDQAVKEYEEYDEEEEYTEKDGDDRVQVSLLSFFWHLDIFQSRDSKHLRSSSDVT